MPPLPLHIIDGNGFLHRAYHARQKAAGGSAPMGGVQAFGSMLAKLTREHQVKHGVVVFDVPGPTWRHERWAGYKAQRKAPDADLVAQMPRFAPMARAHGWPTSAAPGFEGDDLVAAMVDWWLAHEPGGRVVIHASDKDLLQLVTDQVQMADPVRGRTFGAADVQAFLGVPPAQVTDLLAYQGDEIDGVPGVPGVGKVTALQWCQQYPTPADCIAANPRVRGKHPLATLDGVAQLRMSHELVRLRRDAPIRFEAFTPATAPATLEAPHQAEIWRLGTVPTEDGRPWQFEHDQRPCWDRPGWTGRGREDYEERAAILETDAALSRAEAEAQAYAIVRASFR
ncbi:MAG: hypothetical protein IT338_17695 [Thermomicrobiales bacterium]|nr:hypothetical protein [Thermomicrobiales bacterium]